MRKFFLFWLFVLRQLANGFLRFCRFLFSSAKYPVKKVLPLWDRLSHFQRNIIIGSGIAVFITIFHHFSFISDMEDKAMDWMMSSNRSLARMSGINTKNTGVSGYVFIDIDQETYQKWNEPYHIPRSELLSLIKFAVNQAKVVVVDVLISKAGIDPQADQELLSYLQSYNNQNRADLILLRTPAFDGKSLKPLFFPKETLGNKVHFALPLFLVDEDSQIRRWILAKEMCHDGHPERILSAQLLADMLAQKASVKEINSVTSLHVTDNCNADTKQNHSQTGSHGSGNSSAEIHYNNRTIDLNTHGIAERLIYTIPWKKNGRLYSGLGDNKDEDKYKRVSADAVLRASNPSFDWLKDKIVVIGASFAESRDIYNTPLGEMPGALILLNAIKSMNQWGQIKTPPAWTKWLIEIILIVFMAWVYAKVSSFWGTVVIGGTILIAFVPLSFLLFKAGMWVDFAIPVFGMQLHQLVAEYEEKIMLRALEQGQVK